MVFFVQILLGVSILAVVYVSIRNNRANASVILANNFENGTGWSMQSVAPDRLKTVSATDNGKSAPQGSKLARFELRQGDNPLAQWCCKTTNRVEFTTSSDEQKGQDRWYSWYQMFDTTFPSYDTYPTSQNQGWQIFAQWHGNDSVSPPLAWWAAGDNIVLARGDGTYYSELWRGPMNRGQWINIKMHVVWGDAGSIALWINGAKVMDKTGVDNITTPPLYFKTGMYRPNTLSKTAITYMDDFKMGTSEADLGGYVAPAPNPTPPTPSSNPTPTPTSTASNSTNKSTASSSSTVATNSSTSNSPSNVQNPNPQSSEPTQNDSTNINEASDVAPLPEVALSDDELTQNDPYISNQINTNNRSQTIKKLLFKIGLAIVIIGAVGYILVGKMPAVVIRKILRVN